MVCGKVSGATRVSGPVGEGMQGYSVVYSNHKYRMG